MSGKNEKSYAVVTGASRGLGKAFALELARRENQLILVSLPGENLDSIARETAQYGVEAIPYTMDLTRKGEILKFAEWVNANYRIHILINNAGVGGHDHFLNTEIDMLDNMIQLNVRAVAFMTRLLLPNLLEREKAYILNVSSMAALSPIAYKSVYPASKSFIDSLTRSLRHEYKKTTVNFSVLNPGPMDTKRGVTAQVESRNRWVRTMRLTTREIARISIKRMYKGHRVIKLNFLHRLGMLLMRILPVSLKLPFLSNIMGKLLKKESKVKAGTVAN